MPGFWITRSTWGGVAPSHFSGAEVRKILTFGLPLVPGLSAGQLAISMDRLVLALLGPSAGLGVYGAASGLAQRLFVAILRPIGNASFSLAVRAHKEGDEAEASQRLSTNLLVLLAIGIPSSVGLALVASDVAQTLFGPDFRAEAAALLPILGVMYFLFSVRSYYTEQVFQLTERTAALSRVIGVMAAVSIPLHVVLILYFGPEGAAWAMLISQTFGLALSFAVARRLFPLKLPFGDAARVVAATAAMSAVVYAIPAEGTVKSLAIRMAAGMVVYVVAALVLNVSGVRPLVSALIRRIPGVRRGLAPRADAGQGE